MSQTFSHFSETEIDEALSKIRQKSGIQLDRDMLRTLATKTGETWYKKNKAVPLHFARREVLLHSSLSQRNEREAARYQAYASAISILFSARGARVKAMRKRKAVPSPQPDRVTESRPYTFNDGGQGEFLFGTH